MVWIILSAGKSRLLLQGNYSRDIALCLFLHKDRVIKNYAIYKLKICGKGKNNKSATFASEKIPCNSNSSGIYKTEELSSVSPSFSLQRICHPPKAPPNSQLTLQWELSENPPPAEPAPSWSDQKWRSPLHTKLIQSHP